MRIGVFDSGVGGLSVAWAIQKAFPEHKVELVEDSDNLPYGTKTPEQLLKLTLPILTNMAGRCDVIVIACNSLTTNCMTELRKIVQVPLVGVEPMVKPASLLTKSKVIAICATPATLSSKRYAYLKQTYASKVGVEIIEPDCSRWASLIQANELDRQSVCTLVDEVCSQGADVIVLGCTHYHWIEQAVLDAVEGRATVLQPEAAVVKQLGVLLAELPRPA